MTYVQKGKAWLTENTERLRKGLKDGEDSVDGVNVSLWESAFDYPPNKYSASALELFLTKRCFEDNLGQSTAELIQAAFVLTSAGTRTAAMRSSTCMTRERGL
jgi:hypothetical protein